MAAYEPQKYPNETANGLIVRFQVFEFGLVSFGFRVSWDGGSEEGFGYQTLDAAEEGMSDAFARAMENGRIGGVAVPFRGFPVS